MRVKRMLAVGCLLMTAATGVGAVSDSFASDVERVDVIERMGHGGSTYSSSQPDGAGTCNGAGVSVIERMGHGGSTHSSGQSKSIRAGDCHVVGEAGRRVNVIEERIGAGGSIHSSSRPDT